MKEIIENAMKSQSLAQARKKISDEAWDNKGKAAETVSGI